MKIIVPMAGMGKRMRPHTLTTPKPLLRIAGKPIVQRLVEDITKVVDEPVDEIAFIIGNFGEKVEKDLVEVAESLGAKGTICYQKEPLGTAHAILCAKEALSGKVIVAFADTLFKANFELDESKDGILWVKQIEDPSAFGVVKVNEDNDITDYVEKPTEFVSDLAMIGIYYFKDGANLRKELQYLIDNDIIKGGEYQLPDALRNMTEKGLRFSPGKVDAWLDCGNKNATVDTNKQYLGFIKDQNLVASSAQITDSVIIEPVYIGENCVISKSVIGPYVSVHDNTTVENSVIENSIIYSHSSVSNANYENSMVGNYVKVDYQRKDVSIGDYSTEK